MKPRNQPRKLSLGTIESGLERMDCIADKLLRSNTECLIPEDAFIKHNCMNNCHVIGGKFLELIANQKGQVLLWPTSARSITRLVLAEFEKQTKRSRRRQIQVVQYAPVTRSKSNKDCKFTFACKDHDNKVFKPADSVQGFDPNNSETQFKLGLRTMAAYNAWYKGHKKWAREELRIHPDTIILLKQHPYLNSALEALTEWGARHTSVGAQLESEINRWQNAYLQSAWNQAISEIREVPLRPRLAAAGIQNGSGFHVTVTILPTTDSTSLIIATTLQDNTKPLPLSQQRRAATREVANEWEQRFANQPPEQWLPELSEFSEFLYVSPDDYKDNKIVSEDARRSIEKEIATKISIIPDPHTTDVRQVLSQRDPPYKQP